MVLLIQLTATATLQVSLLLVIQLPKSQICVLRAILMNVSSALSIKAVNAYVRCSWWILLWRVHYTFTQKEQWNSHSRIGAEANELAFCEVEHDLRLNCV